jgi:hypothetical protein
MRMARRTGTALAGVLLLAGCIGGDPDAPTETQEVRYSDARVSYTLTTSTVDAVLSHAREVFPDIGFALNYDASRDDSWSECAVDVPGKYDIPPHIAWHANREIAIDSVEGTIDLVWPILQAFIDDGWTVTSDGLDSSTYPHVYLIKDGFSLGVIANTEEAAAKAGWSRLRIGTGSPCLESPDDLADFDPDDPDAYFGPDSAPTVGPFEPPETLEPWEMY